MPHSRLTLLPSAAQGTDGPRYEAITGHRLERLPALERLSAEQRFAMRVVGQVLPFRVNRYVADELIDWDRVPDDPIFQLTFPQPGMLAPEHFRRVAEALRRQAPAAELAAVVAAVRAELNPHPAGQQTLNVPRLDGRPLPGMQHKYRETVLYFPGHGQTCHAYCSFCFRWAQFVGDRDLRFASRENRDLLDYLARHREVSDLLLTGGDPMVMRTERLAETLLPLTAPRLAHVQNVRIGTKALSYWPYRFVTDADADDLMRLIERLVRAGKQVAIMAHLNHWRELEPPVVERAIARLRDAGAVLRAQAPVLRHINDDPAVWARLWRREVALGIQPYYMFVERDTGARSYFELPLVRAWRIYREAMQRVSGLARTARGPSMSAAPGKVEVQGVTKVAGERVLALRFLQARNPDWVQRPFFARYDGEASWLDQLEPAFGEREFFFEGEFRAMCDRAAGDVAASG